MPASPDVSCKLLLTFDVSPLYSGILCDSPSFLLGFSSSSSSVPFLTLISQLTLPLPPPSSSSSSPLFPPPSTSSISFRVVRRDFLAPGLDRGGEWGIWERVSLPATPHPTLPPSDASGLVSTAAGWTDPTRISY